MEQPARDPTGSWSVCLQGGKDVWGLSVAKPSSPARQVLPALLDFLWHSLGGRPHPGHIPKNWLQAVRSTEAGQGPEWGGLAQRAGGSAGGGGGAGLTSLNGHIVPLL